MAEEYEDEYPGLTVPVDKVGADIMYTVNAREVKHYPEDLAEAAICSIWPGKTGPCPVGDGSRPAWPCLPATGKPAKFRWNPFMTPWKGSNPNCMVGTECGHAHRATVVEGPY
ncbi:MAG: hypothetical protein R2875_15380 [Desulfobacterales bacterium]